jgi:hypothetical protein
MHLALHGCTTFLVIGSGAWAFIGLSAPAHRPECQPDSVYGRLAPRPTSTPVSILVSNLMAPTMSTSIPSSPRVFIPRLPTRTLGSFDCSTTVHTLRTCGKAGFRLLVEKMNLQASALSPLPKMYRGTLADPNWLDAMIEEFTTLQANNTWDLVPQPSNDNIVTGKWVFHHKFHPNGSHD